MSLWLYPIAESAGRHFLLKDGSTVDVSVASYKTLVKNGKLAEDDWWYIVQNYNKVKVDDEIYIYTGMKALASLGMPLLKVNEGTIEILGNCT